MLYQQKPMQVFRWHILMSSMVAFAVLCLREDACWSLSGSKGLTVERQCMGLAGLYFLTVPVSGFFCLGLVQLVLTPFKVPTTAFTRVIVTKSTVYIRKQS